MKYVILGAGPAGLSFANRLAQQGEKSFVLLEKEAEVGGLCRTTQVDGAPLDIGGGHFLDVKREQVNEFLFSFMPKEEWNLFVRDSKIIINNKEINHPIEANIWQMDIETQVEYLMSIVQAGCNQGTKMPEDFVNWIYWKLGKKIAKEYMIPYNSKIYNKELNQLGIYWLDKLPNVSFKETLLSCLNKKAYGTEPGHAQFYYPKKYGYGELWRRMGKAIENHVECLATVEIIDSLNHKVHLNDGREFVYDMLVTTIPWTSLKEIRGIPQTLEYRIPQLKYSSVETRYCENKLDTKAQWIYYPDLSLPYHRILVRSNFAFGSKGYWMETNGQRVDLFEKNAIYCYNNKYAYPLNTIDKPIIMKELLEWSESQSIYGLGRWGEWQHYNSDVTVERALQLADNLGTLEIAD